MRQILICVLFVVTALGAFAQTRIVRGFVTNENGAPMDGVTITAQTGEQFTTAADGKFQFPVSFHCKTLTFSLANYFAATVDIDGSYLMVPMKYDNTAELEAKRAEQERIAAEEKARKEAEEKARKEAEAKAKAEKEAQLAREKAVRDSLYAEQMKQKARQEEEKRKKEAEEKARKEAEAKARKEAHAKAQAERKEQIAALDKAYDDKFSNHGLEHNIDVSYAYPLSTGRVVFFQSGIRQYGSTHPVEIDYTLSYKFSRIVSLGGGIGVLYHLKSISIVGDDYIQAYQDFREKQLDVPVFARLKLNFLRTRVRPVLNLQAGYYCLSGVLYGEAGAGVEYRMGRKSALQLSVSARTVPWPYFNENEGASYVMSIAPCVKLGVSF
ncbi:MAG: carboxypeptidase-like regulatory domain-containing protein [Bacteroidales bacterium]|nr:carboxypeptidase-like regulatory domain-containing protein [Bacteroidales bacterium]